MGAVLSSLRFRLTLWYVLVLAVILLAFSLVLYNAVRLSQLREFETALMATSNIIVTKLEETSLLGDVSISLREIPLKEEIYYQYRNPTSLEVIRKSDSLREAVLPLTETAKLAATRGQIALEYATLGDGRTVAYVTRVYLLGGAFPGVLQVGAPLRGIEGNLAELRFWLWAVVPGTLLLTIIGGVFLADRLLKPLAGMNATAREIGGTNLSRRLPVANPRDELGQLATTLNDLFHRLERAFKNQQRFIADASHELRTPLAAMRAETEVALRRERSDAEYRALLQSNLDEVTRLSRMAERLLFLTLSDSGQLPLQFQCVALGGVCQRVFEKLGRLAQEKQIQLALRDLQPCEVQGDPELLEQLLMILVENALKYTPPGGEVALSCGHNRKAAWLEVRDTGIGIAPEHLPHLFERFYRVDKSRSRQQGGTGLGLSIAHSIVAAHQGRIDVQSRQGQGTTFRAFFPR